MNKTFYSVSTGCRLNTAELQALNRKLLSLGLATNNTNPDLIFVNSCAITAKAEREMVQLANKLKRQFPQARLVVLGCAATRWIQQERCIPSVDLLVSNTDKSRVVELLQLDSEQSHRKTGQSQNNPNLAVTDKFSASGRVFIKIQDGCHRFCSYCIVPYLRSTPRSTRIGDLVQQINTLSPQPTEIICTAVNTEAFGVDTGETFIQLITELLAKTHVKRIGFGSIHPWTITDEFLSFYRSTLSKEPRFVQFFHVPIQSATQPVLDLMKRDYSIHDVLSRLRALAAIRSDAFISTDVIVGYLGETDALFEETHNALAQSVISRLHVFPFSIRKGTAASYLARSHPEPTASQKKQRALRLRTLSDHKYQLFLHSLPKRDTTALVIGHTERTTRVLLHNNAELHIPLRPDVLPGSLIHVTIKT